MLDYSAAHEEMVKMQIERRGLREPRLLAAFRSVQRHLFVPAGLQVRAYDDGPLPIGRGQTISQPYIVALMTSLLALQGDENVLEIGTGSGYQAAILSQMAARVITVERFPDLAAQAADLLSRLGYLNVQVHCADGSLGWPEGGPYPAILVTAAAAVVPVPLLDQLAEGGRMVIPVGNSYGQVLQLWTREAGKIDYESIIPVSFVPLRGQYGWSDADWAIYEGGE